MGSSRRRRHSPEQIIGKLREVNRLLGEGQDVAVAAKQLEASGQLALQPLALFIARVLRKNVVDFQVEMSLKLRHQ